MESTWDGQPIAPEPPYGCSVGVRRHSPAGEVETLLLHRAHNGPDYVGNWAWTCPGGARHPGEPAYECALRELEEEAGLVGFDLSPGDLSGTWVQFYVDVPVHTVVRLDDPEHDRFEWLSVEEASKRVRPREAADSLGRLETAPLGEVAFHPMIESDLKELVRWQHAPHAAEWFKGSPETVEAALERYGGRLRGESATRMWVIAIDGVPGGYVQAYRVSAYDEYAEKTQDPEAVAFDYLIGDSHFVGRGWGRVAIWAFLRDILCAEYPDAPRFVASPSHRNHRSIRVLEACGLRQGRWIDVSPREGQPPETEIVCTLDRELWFGF
jgi:8-oxo-dGTP pyrophosphatase MutT (NUDIX family)